MLGARLALALCALVLCAACSLNWITDTVVPTGPVVVGPSAPPGASPTPGPGACAVADMRVSFFSFNGTCDGSSQTVLPVGCTATATATPKLPNGDDAPPEVHGTNIQWSVTQGATGVQVFQTSEPFNLDVKGVTATPRVRIEAVLSPPGCGALTRAIEFQVQ